MKNMKNMKYRKLASEDVRLQFFRFLLCGLVATSVHYAVLVFFMEVLDFGVASLANGCAALIAISFSFVGNRYFVFSSLNEAWQHQATHFMVIYLLTAVIHSSVLLLWSDIYGFDYTLGFVIATTLQLAITFTANKFLVFAE